MLALVGVENGWIIGPLDQHGDARDRQTTARTELPC